MSSQDLETSARLEAHALLDRLTIDGATFSREDARRLIALIPVTPRRRFSFTGLFQGRGPGFRGRAAGVGDVELDGESKERRVSWNTPMSYRIGGYVVTHTPGQILIDLMWIATREDLSGQSCQLVYDTETGEPRAMEISVQRTLTLLVIRLAYISYVPWKTPEVGRTRDG
ncbi:hypothetical protein HPT29_025370 (plasmid) [Microvirga terrae]|uniref:Uncharacterized protein n=1 Tax=Microvirga terrae TaxID=2740529 RepID=A0ABY5RYZ2_9HYPH|nr:hypothetical protein [Microvirga terrae]UVF22485.1 hypothetical protein HPT29_025370 [Microvirga terrae]